MNFENYESNKRFSRLKRAGWLVVQSFASLNIDALVEQQRQNCDVITVLYTDDDKHDLAMLRQPTVNVLACLQAE